MKRDLFLNFASIIILGLVGLFLNLLIPIFYGPEGLGHFNFIMALFICASQFSTFGLHYSTLKYTSEYSYNENYKKKILSSSFILCFFISILISIMCLFLPSLFSNFFKVNYSSFSWYLTIPALIFFSFNKIFLSFINGEKKMSIYAIAISLRYVCMLISFLPFIFLKIHIKYIAFLFLFPEIFVFLYLYCILNNFISFLNIKYIWIHRHLIFSLKSFLAGASIELNSRVDVLILSYFEGEKDVGIYSFSLFFVEGVLQFLSVLRNILNPHLTELYYNKNFFSMEKKIHEFGIKSIYISLLFSLICPIFIFIFGTLLQINFFKVSIIIFIIIMIGVIFSSYLIPIQFLSNQIGNPTRQSKVNFNILITNILLNILFIYFFGLYGAAIGTSLSFIFSYFFILNSKKLLL